MWRFENVWKNSWNQRLINHLCDWNQQNTKEVLTIQWGSDQDLLNIYAVHRSSFYYKDVPVFCTSIYLGMIESFAKLVLTFDEVV